MKHIFIYDVKVNTEHQVRWVQGKSSNYGLPFQVPKVSVLDFQVEASCNEGMLLNFFFFHPQHYTTPG